MESPQITNSNKKHLGCGTQLLLWACIIFFIVVVVLAIRSDRRSRPIPQKRSEIKACENYINNELSNDLQTCYKDYPLDGEIELACSSGWSMGKHGDYSVYDWSERLVVTLNTDESFDQLTKRERYEHIQELKRIGEENWPNLVAERFPWYFVTDDLIEGTYEKTFVWHRLKSRVYIQTPEYRYEDCISENCYEVEKNGHSEIVDVTLSGTTYHIDSNTPKATPKPTPYPYADWPDSTNDSDRTDPWEAHLFDDPDEYADYYAEDFADEYDEDIGDAYNDAYDHWVEWHYGY